jgi:hypothetical protein
MASRLAEGTPPRWHARDYACGAAGIRPANCARPMIESTASGPRTTLMMWTGARCDFIGPPAVSDRVPHRWSKWQGSQIADAARAVAATPSRHGHDRRRSLESARWSRSRTPPRLPTGDVRPVRVYFGDRDSALGPPSAKKAKSGCPASGALYRAPSAAPVFDVSARHQRPPSSTSSRCRGTAGIARRPPATPHLAE